MDFLELVTSKKVPHYARFDWIILEQQHAVKINAVAMESLELINDIAEESRPRRASLFMVRSASRARMVGCAMFAAAGFLVFVTVLIATRPRGAAADICKTKSCGTLAAELVKTMNTSADPCTVRTRYEQLRPHSSSCGPLCRVWRGVPYYEYM